MKIEIIISTMNKQSISDLNLKERNILKNCTIINQITDDNLKLVNEEIESSNIRLFSYRECGLSKSRNRGLEQAKGEILLLTDDDISLTKNAYEIIQKALIDNKNFDILSFRYEKSDRKKNKKYKKEEFIHTYSTIRKVSSIEIVVKRSSIEQKKIKYNEAFGLGAKYNSGEENIFLKDCLDNDLKLKYIPKTIVKHPNISSGMFLKKSTIFGKGALFYKLFGRKAYIYGLLFLIKKKKIIECSFFTAIKLYFKGLNSFRKENKKCF